MTLEEAVDAVVAETDALGDPALTADRVAQILAARVRVSTFAVNTVYRSGQLVTPTDASQAGSLYLCQRTGTSGTTAPSTWDAMTYSGTLTFKLIGAHDGNPYDIRGAIRAIYREKLAMVGKRIDLANGPDKLALSQQFDHYRTLMNASGPEFPF